MIFKEGFKMEKDKFGNSEEVKKLRLSRNTDVKILHKFLRSMGFWRVGKIKPMQIPFASETHLLVQTYKDAYDGVFVDIVYNLQKLPILVNITRTRKGVTHAITVKLNATKSIETIRNTVIELQLS